MANYVDWEDPIAAGEALCNNHATFDSFAWYGEPDDSCMRALVYASSRDAATLTASNAAAIAKLLDEAEESDDSGDFLSDVIAEEHSHWACGWVSGYAIRVWCIDPSDATGCTPLLDNGYKVPTPAWTAYCAAQARMESYPVLDDDDYYERQYEAHIEATECVIADVGQSVIDYAVDEYIERTGDETGGLEIEDLDWGTLFDKHEVAAWLDEHDWGVGYYDVDTGSPSESHVLQAIYALYSESLRAVDALGRPIRRVPEGQLTLPHCYVLADR